MRIKLSDLASKIDQVPCLYFMELARTAIADGEFIIVADEIYNERLSKLENTHGFCAKKAQQYRMFFDKFKGGEYGLPAPDRMPPVVQMAKNVVGTLSKGLEEVSEEVQSKREEICNGCEYYTKNVLGKLHTDTNHRCLLCGCFMNLKRRLKAGDCDAKKWDSLKTPEEIEKQNKEAEGATKEIENQNIEVETTVV